MYRPAYIWASGTKGVKSSMLVLNPFPKKELDFSWMVLFELSLIKDTTSQELLVQ
jgi:hypothetical protein